MNVKTNTGFPGHSKASRRANTSQSRKAIANMMVVRGLDTANEQVQIQALELVRGRRICSGNEVYKAPSRFLLIALQSQSSKTLSRHLIDHMFISHVHQDTDPLIHLHGQEAATLDHNSDSGSTKSVIRTPPPWNTEMIRGFQTRSSRPLILDEDIEVLIQRSGNVQMSTEVRAYAHDIIVFLRTHRAVASGISAVATVELNLLSRVLAPFHGLSFITPSLVDLAVRKVYPHRIALVVPEQEWSIQWGSSLEGVRDLLDGVTIEDVLDEVLNNVDTPL